MYSPCLAAIQQCADNTGNVDRPIYLHRQLGACPHSSRATSESWSFLPNPLVDLCLQWEVVSDGGAAVGELADSIEFVVMNANNRRCLCVLSQAFVFFRLMVSPKSLQACEKQSNNDWSSSWVWVATAASSANIMSLMRTSRTFVLALRRERLKACHLSGYESRFLLLLCLRHVFGNRPKKVQKSIGARTQPCLTQLRISNVSEKLPLICTVPFVSVWKDSIMLCSLGGQPICWLDQTL